MIEKGARINALIEQVHVLASAKEYLSNEPVPIRPALELSLTHLETYIEEQGLSLTLQLMPWRPTPPGSARKVSH